jgi:hypothetical protein
MKLELKFESRTMSVALHSIVRLMPFNSKVEQTESRTAIWKDCVRLSRVHTK